MRIMHSAAAGVTLVASALCAGTASAQGSAQVSVSDFNWALVDLDPNDGIAPSLNFVGHQFETPSSGSVTIDAGGAPVSDARQGGAAFAPLSVSAGNALGSAGGAIAGFPGSGFALNANASLTSNAGAGTLSQQLSTGYLGFVLSPMTAVTFSSRVVLSLGLDLPAPLTGGSVSASARLDVNTDLNDFNEPWTQSASLGTTGGPQSYDAPLTLTVANALGASTLNQLQFSSAINAQVVAAPVPEPGTWAMFAGGLALLFAHARARLRRQAALRGGSRR